MSSFLDIPAADAAGQAMLDELARMGMDIARMVHAQAAANPADFDAAAVTGAYAKAARVVRLTLLLKQRLAASEDNVRRAELRGWVEARKAIVIDLADEAIDRAGRYEPRLHRELPERVDRESEDTLIYTPVREIVTKICKELGIKVPLETPEPQASEPAVNGHTDRRPP